MPHYTTGEMGDRGSRGPTVRGPKGQPGPPGLPGQYTQGYFQVVACVKNNHSIQCVCKV